MRYTCPVVRNVDQSRSDGFSGADVQLVELDRDHPGFNDQIYRARRNQIAALAGTYVAGGPLPSADYNETEQGVWREVWRHLDELHPKLACRQYLEGLEAFGFDRQRIPSFAEVNAQLEPIEGFTLAPVAGLVMPIDFLVQLGHRRFLATQYMRHHSQPLYTPEPDVIHEYVGHVPTLAHPQLAELNHAFGIASARARDERDILALIRVYWYTVEFGLLEEDGELKVWGAGILSSFGELGRCMTQSELRKWDIGAIAETPYDPTNYQAHVFVAPRFGRLRDELLGWLDSIGR